MDDFEIRHAGDVIIGLPLKNIDFVMALKICKAMVDEGRRQGVCLFVIDFRGIGTKESVFSQSLFSLKVNELGMTKGDRMLGLLDPLNFAHDQAEQGLQSLGYCVKWFRDEELGYAWLRSHAPAH